MPFALKALTLLPSLDPMLLLEQSGGTGGELLAGIKTCTAAEDAFSPAMEMSANATSPQP